MELIAEQGLERFTLAEVGERAGYSRAHPAKYFETRDGLIAAVVDHLFTPQQVPGSPGLPTLRAAIRAFFEPDDELAQRCLLMISGSALRVPSVRETVRESNATLVVWIEGHLRAGIDAGTIADSVDVRAQALLILSGMRGAIGHWMLDPTATSRAMLCEEFLATLEYGLFTGEAAPA